MPFTVNSKGVPPKRPGDFQLLPNGNYILEITDYQEGFTSKGDPKVTVDFIVRKPNQYDGSPIKFHNVVFIPKGRPGAGIAIHFLKCIGEPWEESETLDVDPARWMKKRIKAKVVTEEYKDKSGASRKKNVIKEIDPPTESEAQPGDDEIPF